MPLTRETEENKAKIGGPRTESAFDVRMPETTSAQEVPQRITASRRENPYSGKTRGQVRVKTRLRCRTSQGKYKVVNYVDKKHFEWNVMSRAAQDLNDGESRHESWKAQAQEHEYLLEREEVQWTKHANTSSSRDDCQLNSQSSRAEEVCLNDACMNDVHMTSPHDNHDHLHDTTTKGWRFGGSSPWTSHHTSGSRQGHPRHWSRYDGRLWVARSTPHRAKSRTMTEHCDNRQVLRQTWKRSRLRLHQERTDHRA